MDTGQKETKADLEFEIYSQLKGNLHVASRRCWRHKANTLGQALQTFKTNSNMEAVPSLLPFEISFQYIILVQFPFEIVTFHCYAMSFPLWTLPY